MEKQEKFIPYQYEVTAVVKFTIVCDEDGKIEKAVQELNGNLSSSDLISENGCILKGRIVDHEIQKEA
jgi:hypothetical protein